MISLRLLVVRRCEASNKFVLNPSLKSLKELDEISKLLFFDEAFIYVYLLTFRMNYPISLLYSPTSY